MRLSATLLLLTLPASALAMSALFSNNGAQIMRHTGVVDADALHLQIRVTGVDGPFAWVIPASSGVTVTAADIRDFEDLEQDTHLRARLPGCQNPDAAGSCGETSPSPRGPPQPSTPPVVVFDSITVKPTALEVLPGTAAAVTAWLEARGIATDGLESLPVGPDRAFVVAAFDASGALELPPVTITGAPALPLELSSAAASTQPGASLLLWIRAATWAAPTAPYRGLPVSDVEVNFDQDGRTSYFESVARAAATGPVLIDEGRIKQDGLKISRWYTRPSEWSGTLDFAEAEGAAAQRMSLDLSAGQPLFACGSDQPLAIPPRCGFNFCGDGATCVNHQGNFACRCPAGVLQYTGPDQNPHLRCVATGGLICADGRIGVLGDNGAPTCAVADPGDTEQGSGAGWSFLFLLVPAVYRWTTRPSM